MSQTRSSSYLAVACVTSLFAGAGCGDRAAGLDKHTDWLEPAVAIDNALLMVDRGSNRAFVLKLAPLEDDAIVVDLPVDPHLVEARNTLDPDGVTEALVLSRGRRMTTEQDADPSVLSAINARGKLRKYTLGNPFDALAQSEDGRYAIVYRTGQADRLIENPNEIAIIDLDSDPEDDEDAVQNRSLVSFGDSPSKVVFSPEMEILGVERRLAVIMSGRNVTLVDLSHLDRQETTVQLTQPGAPAVTPTQVLFSTEEAKIYVRGETVDDLFVFDLTARPGGSEGDDGTADEARPHNDFRPTLNQLGVGTRPLDMALYGSGDGARLLTLTDGGSRAAVVDTRTGRPTIVALPTNASSILLFEAASPRDDSLAQRALLYRDGDSSLIFLDLADIEERGSRNVDTLALDRSIGRVIPMVGEQHVLIVHDNGVSVVDLASRTIAPVTTNVMLQDALFDDLGRKLWIGPTGQPWIGVLDIETGEPGELLLDTPIEQLVPVFNAGLLAVVHESTVGYVTVIDVEHPTRDDSRSVRGFTLSGLLDRGEP